MQQNIRRILQDAGFDLIRYPDRLLRKRIELINKYNIDLIFDVGSSTGGYGRVMRSIGYKGNILSFEPVKQSYIKLLKSCQKDNRWEAFNYALGEKKGSAWINVSANYDSSSILDMSQVHINNCKNSIKIRSEQIEIKKLDDVFNSLNMNYNNILLKIDTQGYEKQVLNGAAETLPLIKAIQVEMSFEELYKGQILFDELKKFIEGLGFTLCLIETGFCSPITGKLLQADGTFYRI